MAKLISKTYGDALFDVAMENGRLDEITEECHAVAALFEENPDLMRILMHPNITDEEKRETLDAVFLNRVSGEMYGFLRTLVDKNRQGSLNEILEVYFARVREEKKIGTVQVTSALELSEAQKTKIEKKVLETGSYVSLETEYRVDPSLLGGVMIRIGDRVVDGSVKNRLNDLTRSLREA